MNTQVLETLKAIRDRLEGAEFEHFEKEILKAVQDIDAVIKDFKTHEILMHAYYRCRDCGHRWETIDDLAAAGPCKECGAVTDCYHSCDVGGEDQDSLFQAMANEEQCYPLDSEAGHYEVMVEHVASGTKLVKVDAAGRGIAFLKAIEAGADQDIELCASTFQVDLSEEIGFAPKGEEEDDVVLVDGREYYWNAPGRDDFGEDPSCFVQLMMHGGPLCVVRGPDQKLFEVPPEELS